MTEHIEISKEDYEIIVSDMQQILTKLRSLTPKPVANPDFTDLIDRCQVLVIDSINERGWYDRAFQEVIFMQAMICIYGADILRYIDDRDYR